MVVVGVSEACVLARRGGAADRRALHLLQGLVAADVSQAAVTSAAPTLWAVHGQVVTTPQHVPWAEMAKDWGAHLRSASMPAVTLLGRVHLAVDITGAGRRPPRGRF